MNREDAKSKARELNATELVEQLQRSAEELGKRTRKFQTWLKRQTKGKYPLGEFHPYVGSDAVFRFPQWLKVVDLLAEMDWLLQESNWAMLGKDQTVMERNSKAKPVRKGRGASPPVPN